MPPRRLWWGSVHIIRKILTADRRVHPDHCHVEVAERQPAVAAVSGQVVALVAGGAGVCHREREKLANVNSPDFFKKNYFCVCKGHFMAKLLT